jgi:hypothetical protein
MTKKDYQLIARAIQSAQPDDATRLRLVESFAAKLQADNSRFNVATFAAACGCRLELPPMTVEA